METERHIHKGEIQIKEIYTKKSINTKGNIQNKRIYIWK